MLDILLGVALLILLGVAVMSAISLALMTAAKPKGRDLEMLTSSAPGEQLLAYRVCNACLTDVEPNEFFDLVMRALGAKQGAGAVLGLTKRLTGGLWVGGRVFLTSQRIVFMPNALNTAIQKGLQTVALNLRDVSGIERRAGFVTKIVDLETPGGVLSVRGAKMQAFADAIERARGVIP